jgi:hypothetical protein
MSRVRRGSNPASGSLRGAQHCLVCAAQSRAVFDLLVRQQRRLVDSALARKAFGEWRGFCAFHMWLLEQIGDPLSLAKACTPVVDTWAAELQGLVDRPTDQAAARIASARPRPESCTACEAEAGVGAMELNRVLAGLDTASRRDEFSRGAGLCLRHLLAALGAGPPLEVARFLLADQVRRLREISHDLHAYVAKRDALRRDLLSEDEHDAWQRALLLLAGARTVRDIWPG